VLAACVSFTITDYNNWALAVNEDQGSLMDSRAGVASTTGDWQHVAVRQRSTHALLRTASRCMLARNAMLTHDVLLRR
jgi:hypothetical protein